MKNTTYQLTLEEKENILTLLTRLLGPVEHVQFAYVYGSFAEDMPFHDIDIGVYLDTNEQTAGLMHAVEIAGMLERELHISVDVRVLNGAPTSFLYHVFRGTVIVDRNESLRQELVEQAIRKYLDIKPLIRQGLKEAFAA